jgi:hypothetical protein
MLDRFKTIIEARSVSPLSLKLLTFKNHAAGFACRRDKLLLKDLAYGEP